MQIQKIPRHYELFTFFLKILKAIETISRKTSGGTGARHFFQGVLFISVLLPIHLHIHVYIYKYIQTYIYIYVYMHVHICVYIRIHTLINYYLKRPIKLFIENLFNWQIDLMISIKFTCLNINSLHSYKYKYNRYKYLCRKCLKAFC